MIILKLKEVRKICAQFSEVGETAHRSYGRTEQDYIEACDKLEALGLEWGDPLCRSGHFQIKRGSEVFPSSYTPFDSDTFYIVWDNFNVGRAQFAAGEFYHCTAEEWNWFWDKLLSYKPLDVDLYHHRMTFSICNGKKLMRDYDGICKDMKRKCELKIRQEKIRRLKEELRELEAEQLSAEAAL